MIAKFIIRLIRIYQVKVSARRQACCRFEPTCSEYAILAIQKYGVIPGVVRTVNRLLRCKPPNGGVDYP
ncbi:MAG: membrane protein insertion efficiency factor YidD [Pseudomonadota bacterium]